MILRIYTIIHVLIGLVAIFTGIVVVFGMFGYKHLNRMAGRNSIQILRTRHRR